MNQPGFMLTDSLLNQAEQAEPWQLLDVQKVTVTSTLQDLCWSCRVDVTQLPSAGYWILYPAGPLVASWTHPPGPSRSAGSTSFGPGWPVTNRRGEGLVLSLTTRAAQMGPWMM